MDEYISRETLLAEIAADYGNWIAYNDTDESYRQGVDDNYNDTIRLINDIPTADVQPVKHGRWIKVIGENYECSNCKAALWVRKVNPISNYKYCWSCGYKMDGDNDGKD